MVRTSNCCPLHQRHPFQDSRILQRLPHTVFITDHDACPAAQRMTGSGSIHPAPTPGASGVLPALVFPVPIQGDLRFLFGSNLMAAIRSEGNRKPAATVPGTEDISGIIYTLAGVLCLSACTYITLLGENSKSYLQKFRKYM